jgi:hypothetical protein
LQSTLETNRQARPESAFRRLAPRAVSCIHGCGCFVFHNNSVTRLGFGYEMMQFPPSGRGVSEKCLRHADLDRLRAVFKGHDMPHLSLSVPGAGAVLSEVLFQIAAFRPSGISDLRRKIMRYIRLYGKTAKPFRWKYADPTRRIKPW